MLSREFNINLDIIKINKYIKPIQVYQNDIYQCILNITVSRNDKRINLDHKDAIIHILESNDELIKYNHYEILDNTLKVKLVNINEVGPNTIHIMLVDEKQKLTLPLIKVEVVK